MIDVKDIENIPWRGMLHACSAFILCFFSLMSDEERKDPNTTISGPSAARQQNATEMMAHIERWIGSCDFSGDPDQYC